MLEVLMGLRVPVVHIFPRSLSKATLKKRAKRRINYTYQTNALGLESEQSQGDHETDI